MAETPTQYLMLWNVRDFNLWLDTQPSCGVGDFRYIPYEGVIVELTEGGTELVWV